MKEKEKWNVKIYAYDYVTYSCSDVILIIYIRKGIRTNDEKKKEKITQENKKISSFL